jgi:hypothetical protein
MKKEKKPKLNSKIIKAVLMALVLFLIIGFLIRPESVEIENCINDPEFDEFIELLEQGIRDLDSISIEYQKRVLGN